MFRSRHKLLKALNTLPFLRYHLGDLLTVSINQLSNGMESVLRAEVNTEHQRDGWYECTAELQPPTDMNVSTPQLEPLTMTIQLTHAIEPVLKTARLAEVPKKIPNAVQSCHDMTRPPRTIVGAFSALKTGTVTLHSRVRSGEFAQESSVLKDLTLSDPFQCPTECGMRQALPNAGCKQTR